MAKTPAAISYALELGCAVIIHKNYILYAVIFINLKIVRKIIFVNINLTFLIHTNCKLSTMLGFHNEFSKQILFNYSKLFYKLNNF